MRESYWTKRIRTDLRLALLSALLTCGIYLSTPPPDVRHRLSMGTAYASLALLAWTLWLGPWNVLRRRPNPVSFDGRRDVAIWAGALALLHTGIGLTVHLRGRMWMYFFQRLHPLHLQNNQFGWANWIGGGSALLLLLLLAISNDVSLRSLGLHRWKSLQRLTYLAVALAIAHGALFQRVEKRSLPFIAIFALLAGSAALLQMLGWVRVRNNFSAPRSAEVRHAD